MSTSKFVVKCGNFAVLVDLHILPGGSTADASWGGQQHKEEVSDLIKDTVDKRVKQFLEAKHQKGPQRPRKELTPANPLIITGEPFCLTAYFTQRHVNLKCVARRQQTELRVFPERCVVFASPPGDRAEFGRKTNLAAMERGGPSKSKYFPVPQETPDSLSRSAVTGIIALKKIAKQPIAAAHHSEPGRAVAVQTEEFRSTDAAPSDGRPGEADPSGSQPPHPGLAQAGAEGGSSSQEDGGPPAFPCELIMKTRQAHSLTEASTEERPPAGSKSSLTGPSVEPFHVPSGPSERRHGGESVPRKSRLRRLKKS